MKKVLTVLLLIAILGTAVGCSRGSKAKSNKPLTLPSSVPEQSIEANAKSEFPSAYVTNYDKIENGKTISFTLLPPNLLIGHVVPVNLNVVPSNVKLANVMMGSLESLSDVFHFHTGGDAKITTKGINEFFIVSHPYNWIVVYVPRRFSGKDYLYAYVFKVDPLVWNRAQDLLKDFLQKNLIRQ